MGEAKITRANLMGDVHVYYITLKSSWLGDKKFIVYDNDGDGTIINDDGSTSEENIIDSIGVKNEEFEAYAKQAQELITEFRKELPAQLKLHKTHWKDSFGKNAPNDYVLDENRDGIPDKLGFITCSGTEVSISYDREDLEPICTLKDSINISNEDAEKLLRKSDREQRDILFDCKSKEPRGVAQYFKAYDKPDENLAIACGEFEEKPAETVASYADKFSEIAHNVEHSISATASTTYSWSKGVLTSASNYLSSLLDDDDKDDDDYYSRHDVTVSHLKL